MRIVYGAGAVAVVSVMAVGLVQPDWTATADQQTKDGTSTDSANLDVAIANAGLGTAAQDATRSVRGARRADSAPATPEVRVRHVVRYVHLKPGQTAPPGATVITPDAPQPRVVVANQPAPRPNRPAVNRPPARPPAASQPHPQPTARPAPKPQPTAQPPAPNPPPPVRTRQSGRRP